MRFLLCVAAFAALAGCGSARMIVRGAPADVTVSYAGSVGDTGTVSFDDDADGGSPDEGATVRIEARVIRVPASRASHELGKPLAPAALSLTPEQLVALSEDENSLLHGSVSAPVLTVFNRQRGLIELRDQTAYVGGFELRSQGGAWVADPVIRTLESGIGLRVRPTVRNDGEIDVALDITVSEPVRPVGRHTVSVLGAPMILQAPMLLTQRLSAWGVMRKDRVLLLTGLLAQDGDVLLVLLSGSVEGTPQSAPQLIPPGTAPGKD